MNIAAPTEFVIQRQRPIGVMIWISTIFEVGIRFERVNVMFANK